MTKLGDVHTKNEIEEAKENWNFSKIHVYFMQTGRYTHIGTFGTQGKRYLFGVWLSDSDGMAHLCVPMCIFYFLLFKNKRIVCIFSLCFIYAKTRYYLL